MTNEYRYFWTPSSSQTIDEYVKKVKPSVISDRDAPGGYEKEEDPEEVKSQGAAMMEAKDILNELQTHIDWTQQHTGFAKRATGGAETKTSYIKKVHDEATDKLKKVSKKHKWTVGKWLLFPRHVDVDRTWSLLAPSVASGPLRDAGVFLAKVAPTPASTNDDTHAHLICLYMRDIYDITVVRQVLKVLLKDHGLEPSAAKSDLYTLVGIDSSHPTRLRSSIWRVAEVLEGGKEEVQKLKSQYEPKASIRAVGEAPRKQTFDKDGFIGSDSEDEAISRNNKLGGRRADKRDGDVQKEAEPQQPTAKRAKIVIKKSKARLYQDNDIFAAGSDSD